MPSAVESNKDLPNPPELISKFKSPVLCKQSLCLGKCHNQHIGRGVGTGHPSSLNSHSIWPGGWGNLSLFVLYWEQQMFIWMRGYGCASGAHVRHNLVQDLGEILLCTLPYISFALVFRGPKPRVRASKRPQWISGGFIHPDPDEQEPGWASSMLIALAECPHWQRKLEKLFPVRQVTGRSTS